MEGWPYCNDPAKDINGIDDYLFCIRKPGHDGQHRGGGCVWDQHGKLMGIGYKTKKQLKEYLEKQAIKGPGS